jgi:hypothetical protein
MIQITDDATIWLSIQFLLLISWVSYLKYKLIQISIWNYVNIIAIFIGICSAAFKDIVMNLTYLTNCSIQTNDAACRVSLCAIGMQIFFYTRNTSNVLKHKYLKSRWINENKVWKKLMFQSIYVANMITIPHSVLWMIFGDVMLFPYFWIWNIIPFVFWAYNERNIPVTWLITINTVLSLWVNFYYAYVTNVENWSIGKIRNSYWFNWEYGYFSIISPLLVYIGFYKYFQTIDKLEKPQKKYYAFHNLIKYGKRVLEFTKSLYGKIVGTIYICSNTFQKFQQQRLSNEKQQMVVKDDLLTDQLHELDPELSANYVENTSNGTEFRVSEPNTDVYKRTFGSYNAPYTTEFENNTEDGGQLTKNYKANESTSIEEKIRLSEPKLNAFWSLFPKRNSK